MDGVLKDIRFAFRSLLKQPAFTIIAVVTLGLGIGANSAIFSVVNAVLLRPLPFKDPERLMVVWERRANSGRAKLPLSGHEYAAFKERSKSFEALTIFHPNGFNLTGRGSRVRRVLRARTKGDTRGSLDRTALRVIKPRIKRM